MDNQEWSINTERIRQEFVQLTAIDSVSFREREMADCLRGKLEAMGFAVYEDDAGKTYGGNAGNVYGFLKGTLPGEPLLLAAHMDTVQPGIGKQAIFAEAGRITSDGTTVLGADDVAGIVEILEGIRSLQEAGIAHRDVEVLFPIGEELYDKGTKQFDFAKLQAKEAYVLDLSGPIGTAALRAPSIISFRITIKGKAAHAGFEPEKGIHAIALMSKVITQLRQGHIDEETTFNIGTIAAEGMSNIVPETCTCEGEVRSFSHEKALQCLKQTEKLLADTLDGTGAQYTLESTVNIEAYRIEATEPVVTRFVKACEGMGLDSELTDTFGGSDNNVFATKGIRGIVLSCGMYQVHSVKEYTRLQDLAMGAELVGRLLQL
jgi:tripeptide aminopeptidase